MIALRNFDATASKPIQSLLAVALVFLLASAPLRAHQQKEAFITVSFKPESQTLEISHRFLIHDAEHIFSELYDLRELELSGDLNQDQASQVAFATYLRDHFRIKDEQEHALALETIGFEVDGKHFWFYQETTQPTGDSLRFQHTALHSIWPKHVNHINVEKDGLVKSARLTKSDAEKWQTIAIPKSSLE